MVRVLTLFCDIALYSSTVQYVMQGCTVTIWGVSAGLKELCFLLYVTMRDYVRDGLAPLDC